LSSNRACYSRSEGKGILLERRKFLATFYQVTGLISVGGLVGCELNLLDRSKGGSSADPVLLELPDGRIRIQSPVYSLPLAYVSRRESRIYVAYESRIGVSVLLAAHISVSSGLWRIPLLGDDVGVPIDAGDAEREFVEHDIREWDPEMLPIEGDYRVQKGAPTLREVSLHCVPVLPEKGWVSGGPWSIMGCDGVADQLCREVFASIGQGRSHESKSYRTCVGTGQTVEFLSWICPQD